MDALTAAVADIDVNSKGDGTDRDAIAANGQPKSMVKQKCVFTANSVSRVRLCSDYIESYSLHFQPSALPTPVHTDSV